MIGMPRPGGPPVLPSLVHDPDCVPSTHRVSRASAFGVAALLVFGLLACVAPRHPLDPRVPSHKADEAKNLKAPFGDTRTAPSEIVAEGERLYQGWASCFYCHGIAGDGKGTAANKLRPHPPADFTNCDLHRVRSDGELFWVLKHGSPGTGMVGHIPWKLSEEEGWKVVAYLRTFCT